MQRLPIYYSMQIVGSRDRRESGRRGGGGVRQRYIGSSKSSEAKVKQR